MKIVLKLYVFGMNPHVERAVARLRRMLDELPGWEYDLSVCDVVEQPEVAEDDKILATPALVLMSPPPGRKVIGDLSDTKSVFLHLGLPLRDTTEQERRGMRGETVSLDRGRTLG